MSEPAVTPRVEVRRSARRRRTVTAFRERDAIVVLIPGRMSKADERRFVDDMVARVLRREARAKPPAGDADLQTRAGALAAAYLGPEPPQPAAVSWVKNQNSRWGSCTPSSRTIRLSHRLQALPDWVVDYVLLHELAHLIEANHTARFWSLVDRYPDAQRARGYLEGTWRAPGQVVPVSEPAELRRIALVVAEYAAVPPPGVQPADFAAAALADTYEVLAGLDGVTSGIVSRSDQHPAHEELLWPGSVLVAPDDLAAVPAEALVLVPADVPDLPQLVVAKVFKALVRAEVCVAPERGGDGVAAFGVRLPWPDWLPPWLSGNLSLDTDPYPELAGRVPDRRLLARGPEWRRLRTPGATDRLDPGLEGWAETRALLSGRPLTGGF